ncbi:hypothetical protein WJX74_008889 [Apatococcus lobatus]|uniref:Mitochondrial carrier protein n=1 Tax=Apatococcus lobatus TaxID=904363 RepID=A0AAW1RVM7_9CHLO
MASPGDDQPDTTRELGFRERIIAAAGASVVSAFVVNPLDVVKTRMQAQAAGAGSAAAAASAGGSIQHNVLLEKFAFTLCPETCPNWAPPGSPLVAATSSSPQQAGPRLTMSRGTLASMRHIARTEGWSQLWRGTDMALLMAMPMVGIYMPLYDYTRGALQPELGASLAPLTAGALSRTAAVLCTAPLDLLRTRMQAMLRHTHLQPAVAGASASSRTSQWMEIIRNVQASSGSGTTARVGALWTGVGATLARDVPFSALYWALLEPVRAFLLPEQQASSASAASQPGPVPGPSYRPHPPAFPTERGPVSSSTSQQPSVSGPMQAANMGEEPHAHTQGSANHAAMSGRAPVRWAYEQHAQHSCAAASVGSQHEASSSRQSHGEPGPQSWMGQQESRDSVPWQSHASSNSDVHEEQHRQSRLIGQCQGAAASSDLAESRAAELKDRGSLQAPVAEETYGSSKTQLLLANLVAGAVGGSAAAALTQPLDVVKTRAQLGHHGRSTSVLQALRELAQEGGVRALFTGVTPRALKAAPACAIVLASYETLKALYADS